jgi:ISXO2-like transposase domain
VSGHGKSRPSCPETSLELDAAHANTAESFFSLLKRGVYGAWHHVSREHLPKYADEFAFRWTHRKVTDGERTVAAIKATEGKRLTYRQVV